MDELKPELPTSQLMTAEEVADYFRVSVATVRRWTNAGKLSCYRIGGNRERRFSPEQVRAFLTQHEQPMPA
jgi:transcriptional repressor of dcmA and dcmR